MQVGEKEVTITAFLVTWIIGAFAYGKKDGILATKVEKHSKDIEKNSEDIEDIQGKFTTENGEPALMSFRAHRHICVQNNDLLMSEFNHVKETVEKQSDHMNEMGRQLGCVAKTLAVLEEKIKK